MVVVNVHLTKWPRPLWSIANSKIAKLSSAVKWKYRGKKRCYFLYGICSSLSPGCVMWLLFRLAWDEYPKLWEGQPGQYQPGPISPKQSCSRAVGLLRKHSLLSPLPSSPRFPSLICSGRQVFMISRYMKILVCSSRVAEVSSCWDETLESTSQLHTQVSWCYSGNWK